MAEPKSGTTRSDSLAARLPRPAAPPFPLSAAAAVASRSRRTASSPHRAASRCPAPAPTPPRQLAGARRFLGLGLRSGPAAARQIDDATLLYPSVAVCAAMAFMGRRAGGYICSELCGSVMNLRMHSSRVDWKQLRPMILKRIKNRAKDYPIKRMIPVAEEVVRAREVVTEGVSTLLKVVPVHSCKFCPEIHVGAVGHQMKTCHGFKRMIKDQPHKWGPGGLNNIVVPVESFHLENMFQDEIRHDQRFDFTRVPAVLELCHQAGAEIPDGVLYRRDELSTTAEANNQNPTPLLPGELRLIGQRTLEAWERLRLGVTKLLLVYPSKVCEHCSEVHVGLSGHKARMCGVFKFEGWRGKHKWKKAGVDDLVPQNVVWHQRPHDPPILVNSGRDYYGHAPAVIELCVQVGARAPRQYRCMMKEHGLAPPIQRDQAT